MPTIVPHAVELHPVPDTLVKMVPGYSADRYFRLEDGRIVIVQPHSMKVVAVLK